MAEEEEQKTSNLGIPYKMYMSRALSAWGDRMWNFGSGLFLMGLMGDDLRLVGIYGFAKCFTVIMFGAVIGNWIDRSKRLTSAKIFLALKVMWHTMKIIVSPHNFPISWLGCLTFQYRTSSSSWTAYFLLHSFTFPSGLTVCSTAIRHQLTLFREWSSP